MPKNLFKLMGFATIALALTLLGACTTTGKNTKAYSNSSVTTAQKLVESHKGNKSWTVVYRTTYEHMNALFPRLSSVTPDQMEQYVQSFDLFVDFINSPNLSDEYIMHNRKVSAKVIANALNARKDLCLFITDEMHKNYGVFRTFSFKYGCDGPYDIVLKTEKSLPLEQYTNKTFNVRLVEN